ncbi:hypothetical protein ES706_05196 [subsurface metagenome]
MIQSGVGIPSPEQIANLAVLGIVLSTTYSLNKVSSPKVKTRPPNPSEQAELLDKFLKLNPEAQRGAIRYIEEMRMGYKKKKN